MTDNAEIEKISNFRDFLISIPFPSKRSNIVCISHSNLRPRMLHLAKAFKLSVVKYKRLEPNKIVTFLWTFYFLYKLHRFDTCNSLKMKFCFRCLILNDLYFRLNKLNKNQNIQIWKGKDETKSINNKQLFSFKYLKLTL